MDVVNLTAGSREFTSNAFLVTGDGGRRVLVDAGNDDGVVDGIRSEAGGLDALVLTHTHPDHVGSVPDVVEAFGVDVWGPTTEERLVDHALADGDTFAMAGTHAEVVHTPGHIEQHLCLYGDGVLFSGDLVFAGGSFGRTDLEGGDRETLVASIEILLDRIGDRPIDALYAGHQPPVEEEARRHVEASLKNARQMR
jgi:hydroxyacylglutathione hydrolase